MSEAKTGGPAFPCIEPTVTGIDSNGIERYDNEAHGGMSLRDYFAAKADIPWEVATEIVYRLNGNQNGTPMQIMEQRTRMCYVQADLMIEARKT